MRQCLWTLRVVSRKYLSEIQKEQDLGLEELKEMEVGKGVLQ